MAIFICLGVILAIFFIIWFSWAVVNAFLNQGPNQLPLDGLENRKYKKPDA